MTMTVNRAAFHAVLVAEQLEKIAALATAARNAGEQADTSILIAMVESLSSNTEHTDALRSYFEQATEKKAA